jgi:uncharacterized protein (TIGR03067 family)
MSILPVSTFLKFALASLLAAAIVLTANRGFAQAPNPTFAQLEGEWSAEKVISAGRTVPKEKFPYELHFRAPDRLIHHGITIGNVTGRGGEDKVTLDSTRKPAVMRMTREVKGRTRTVLAIFKIEENLLTLCFLRGADGQPSSELPKAFESTEETRADLMVLKRKPAAQQ